MDNEELGVLLKALVFAAEKHRDQKRKGPEASPYINHPIAVASVLFYEGGVADIPVLCAALLHDTIEDTETTGEELSTEFGPEIRGLVDEVTDDKSLPKEVRKQHQIDHSSNLSEKAKQIKLADKICNLRDIKNRPPADWSLERKLQYFEWAKAVVDRIREANPPLGAIFDKEFRVKP